MGESQFFTTLDLKSGFYQTELAEKDREKTAFSINNGKYEFCRLPFGLKNAPSIFQRAIDAVVREGISMLCCVYADDDIIFSKTKEDHVRDVDWVLRKLLKAGMRVSQENQSSLKRALNTWGS